MFDVKEELKAAFTQNKSAILTATLILFVSLFLGYVLEPHLYSYFNPVVDDLTQKVQSGVVQFTFTDIFLNNFFIVLRMFVFGIFFCFSALILAFNGFFVGYYVANAPSLFHVLVLIVPHGIFEFSSCILACASGFVLFNFGYLLVKTFSNEASGKFFEKFMFSYDKNFDKLKHSLILLAVSIVLMIIAGVVEVYLTLPISEFVFSILG